MGDDEDDNEQDQQHVTIQLSDQEKDRLDAELAQAESCVIRTRAELGYSISNHLTGHSSRLEEIAKQLVAVKSDYLHAKDRYEDQLRANQHALVTLKAQKKRLVSEIRSLTRNSESHKALARAEVAEARMVNRRLKKQNELLLGQLRSLVRKSSFDDLKSHDLSHETKEEEGAIPYTLNASDLALLNGQRRAAGNPEAKPSSFSMIERQGSSHHDRLVAFFE